MTMFLPAIPAAASAAATTAAATTAATTAAAAATTTAAATTAAAAGTAAATTAAAAGGGYLATASALAAIAGGAMSVASGIQSARQAEYQARLNELQGRRDAIQVNEALLQTLAYNTAAAAAGGLAPLGSAAEAQRASQAKAARELDVMGFTTAGRARAQRQAGQQAMAAGVAGGIEQIGGVLGSEYRRRETIRQTGEAGGK